MKIFLTLVMMLLPLLAQSSNTSSREARLEEVKALVERGTIASLDPLVKATADADAEIQMRATDGLVNYYLPGYYRDGLTGSMKRAADSLKGKFTDVNKQIVPPDVAVREDVIRAAGRLIRAGASVEARGNAARAVGVLRGKQALPDVEEGLKSRDAFVLQESLVAARKIGDPSVNPAIARLLKDPDEKVQIAALEALAYLGARDTAGSVEELVRTAPSEKLRRNALTTLATFGNESARPLYDHYIGDKDPALRAAAAEGIARLRKPADLAAIEQRFGRENKNGPKLSLAFASVMLGRKDLTPDGPLDVLLRNLKSRFWVDTARPFLLELSRDAAVREALYPAMSAARSKDEKLGLCWVMMGSGDAASIPHLERLKADPEPEVSGEAIRAIQMIQARTK